MVCRLFRWLALQLGRAEGSFATFFVALSSTTVAYGLFGSSRAAESILGSGVDDLEGGDWIDAMDERSASCSGIEEGSGFDR